ncbi:MAG: 23S rRNA (adenine(2503)-C(2))-methyltransferase RlmN [Candidatus Aminicenantes bacterium]|nr:23S rRNA (adenine(2503)-C(2))-methyltransferase RlmN [Candidatus Aminicenantes bacterium]
MKKDIQDLTLDELRTELEGWGEPAYRAMQIFEWIYKKGARSFDAMTDLPKSLREELEDHFRLSSLELAEGLRSADGTQKYLFRLADGAFIETVLIPSGTRRTLCLSTQVGCKFGCVFCASGREGFKRNLSSSEIVGQILFRSDASNVRLSNFVLMGMGEPLDNFENVVRAVRIMNAREGLDIGARRITISTVGIVPAVKELARLGLQVNLSLSLHATTEALRSRLLPVNRKYPLAEVVRASAEYAGATGRMITVEYILISRLNDTAADAGRLAAIAKRLRAKINLIPYSPGCGPEWEASSRDRTDAFLRCLQEKGVSVTVRLSKGADIRAACGQLAGKRAVSPG